MEKAMIPIPAELRDRVKALCAAKRLKISVVTTKLLEEWAKNESAKME